MIQRFHDRADAGRQLGRALLGTGNHSATLVLGLARGGVPVAYEVAHALGASLDVFVVRKLGVPDHPELAMGAIASGGVRVLNEEVVAALHIPRDAIEEVAVKEQRELERRESAYRGDRPAAHMAGRTVILVDDGLATGSSMRAAVASVRVRQPRRLIVAVPVAPEVTCRELRSEVDEVICLMTPDPFHAVGLWYDNFDAPLDAAIRGLLQRDSPSDTSLL